MSLPATCKAAIEFTKRLQFREKCTWFSLGEKIMISERILELFINSHGLINPSKLQAFRSVLFDYQVDNVHISLESIMFVGGYGFNKLGFGRLI